MAETHETPKQRAGFSRRHLTSAAHEEARARYLADDARKRADAAERAEARKSRTPAEQLAMLNERLGNGAGAVRERARLRVPISTPNRK